MDKNNELFLAYLRLEFHSTLQEGFADGRRSPYDFTDSAALAHRRYPGPKHMAVWGYLAHMPEGSTLADALKVTTIKSAGYRTLEKTSAQLGAFIAGEAMELSVMRDLCTGLRADEAQTSFMMGLTGASGSKATESGTDAIYARLRDARAAALPPADDAVGDVEVLPPIVSAPVQVVPSPPAGPGTIRANARTMSKVEAYFRWRGRTVARWGRNLDGPPPKLSTQLVVVGVLIPIALFSIVALMPTMRWLESTSRATTGSEPDPERYDPGLGNVALIAFPRERSAYVASYPLTLDDVDGTVVADEDGETPVLRIEIGPGADLAQDEHERDIVPIRFIYHAPPALATALEDSPDEPPIELSANLQVFQRTPGSEMYYALDDNNDATRIWDLPTQADSWTSTDTQSVGTVQPWMFGANFEVGRTYGDTIAEAGTALGLRTAGLPCGVSELNLEATLHMRNAPLIDSSVRKISVSVDKKCSI